MVKLLDVGEKEAQRLVDLAGVSVIFSSPEGVPLNECDFVLRFVRVIRKAYFIKTDSSQQRENAASTWSHIPMQWLLIFFKPYREDTSV